MFLDTRSKLLLTLHKRLVRILSTRDVGLEDDQNSKNQAESNRESKPRSSKVLKYFETTPNLIDIKSKIPMEYFTVKRLKTLPHLYLADREMAKDIVACILPFLQKDSGQVICETNAGLGLITRELLKNNIVSVRMYENCCEFRKNLKDLSANNQNKVELFTKDLFSLGFLSRLDKYDPADRISVLLKGVLKRKWNEDPVLSIIGPMPNTNFISYLFKMLALQQEIITYGRVQIFALMKPRDYAKLKATPGMSLRIYQVFSVLFQLFFDCDLLRKYCRKSFVPWQSQSGNTMLTRNEADADYIYLVQINLKKTLPVENQYLLHLYYFVKQGFCRGKSKVIPTLEKWLPDIGGDLLTIKGMQTQTFPNLNVYIEFGELTPEQILQIFLKVIENPRYDNSPFLALIESILMKTETVENYESDSNTTRAPVKLQE